MQGRRLAGVCLVAGMLGAAGEAQASPQEVIGFGYRSIAMGRSGVALGEGADVVHANPALLSAQRRLGLQLGLTAAVLDLHADGAGALPDYPALSASTIGGVLPLPFEGVLKDRVTLGLGFITPFDVVVRGRVLFPERPQFLLADRVQSVAVQAGLGLDLGYGLRIGGGFAALAALTGSVTVATDASGRIGTVVEDTLIASYAPIVGAAYDIDDSWRVGLTFRGELQARFNVVIVAEDLGPITIPPLNISGVAQYDPWQLAAEVAYGHGPMRAALGITYKHWSAYPGPQEATVRCEDVPEPDTPCSAPSVEPVGYTPTAVPHIGVEGSVPLAHEVLMRLRGGYAFEPTPAPEQSGVTNMFDNHRSLFSAGYGFTIEGAQAVTFDGFVQLQWLHDRDHTKALPEDGGPISTRGLLVAGGTAAEVRF